MHELLAQLETYLRTAWRYRWAGLAAAAVICLVGWVAVLLMPNKYEVSAKVFLDTSSLLRPVLRGLAVETSARQEAILMVRRTLLTRPNLESVARTADMDLKTKTPEEMEAVVEELAKTVSRRMPVRYSVPLTMVIVSGTRMLIVTVTTLLSSRPSLAL